MHVYADFAKLYESLLAFSFVGFDIKKCVCLLWKYHCTEGQIFSCDEK